MGVRAVRVVATLAAAVLGLTTLPFAPARGQSPDLLGIEIGLLVQSPFARVTICVGQQRDVQVYVDRFVVAVYADATRTEIGHTSFLPGVPLSATSTNSGVASVAPARIGTGTGTAVLKVTGVKKGTTSIRVAIVGSVTRFVPPTMRGNPAGKGELTLPVRVDECRYRISGHGTYSGSVISAFMQLYPTYVDTVPGATVTEQGGVFGAAVWAGPCASIIVGNFPDANVTVAVSASGDDVTVTVRFHTATSVTSVTCPYTGTGQVHDPGIPDLVTFQFAAVGGTIVLPNSIVGPLTLSGAFTLSAIPVRGP